MITAIKEFFGQMIEPGFQREGAPAEHALQVATAALLLEMVRMDDKVAAAETATVVATLRTRFTLDAEEIATLLALADQEARQAPGYYQFTALINKGLSIEQKIRVIESLWQVAFADGHLDAHEDHLMRKISDLLYIPHAEYVGAKQRAREAAGSLAAKP